MRKLLVILGGAAVGGAVGWFLESEGAHPQVVTAVGTGITAVVAWIQEALDRRKETSNERIVKLVHGDLFENPVVVALYVVLALQIFQRFVGALVGGSIGLALVSRDVEAGEVADVVAVASPPVVFVLSLFLTIYVSYWATQRLEKLPMLWISAGLLVNTLINIAVLSLIADYIGQEWSTGSLAVEGGIQFALLLGASLIGYYRARGQRNRFVLNRLAGELTPSDQRDLIDLVASLPIATPKAPDSRVGQASLPS